MALVEDNAVFASRQLGYGEYPLSPGGSYDDTGGELGIRSEDGGT